MKFRGTPTYGGVSMYRLMASVHEGAPAEAGDAQVLNGGNALRDQALRRADGLRDRLSSKDIKATLRRPERGSPGGWWLPLPNGEHWKLTDAQASVLLDEGKRNWLQANRLGATLVALNAGTDLEELLHEREDSTDTETVVAAGFASGGRGGTGADREGA